VPLRPHDWGTRALLGPEASSLRNRQSPPERFEPMTTIQFSNGANLGEFVSDHLKRRGEREPAARSVCQYSQNPPNSGWPTPPTPFQIVGPESPTGQVDLYHYVPETASTYIRSSLGGLWVPTAADNPNQANDDDSPRRDLPQSPTRFHARRGVHARPQGGGIGPHHCASPPRLMECSADCSRMRPLSRPRTKTG
jgi:hypothetical protein